MNALLCESSSPLSWTRQFTWALTNPENSEKSERQTGMCVGERCLLLPPLSASPHCLVQSRNEKGTAMSPEKKSVWGWALYDWANSAFATTVMAGFFPIFFKQYWSHGADVNMSTAQLGLAKFHWQPVRGPDGAGAGRHCRQRLGQEESF